MLAAEEFLQHLVSPQIHNSILENLENEELTQIGLRTSPEYSGDEIKNIAELGNILSLSNKNENKKTALRIGLLLPSLRDNEMTKNVSAIILSRLSNFPMIKYLFGEDYRQHMGIFTELESIVHETILTEEFGERKVILTKFQKEITEAIRTSEYTSLSGPTSSGKSWLLKQLLLDELTQKTSSIGIYIVPTRALIHQVITDLMDNLRFFPNVPIRISASPEVPDVDGGSVIFVLTQERMQRLISSKDIKKLKVTFLLIDEAHEIQNGARGVILEEVIRRSYELWPNSKMVFASPLVNNPEYFGKMISRSSIQAPLTDIPTVGQVVLRVAFKRNELTFSNIKNKQLLNKTISGAPSSSVVRSICRVFMETWNGDQAILFANGPMDAVKMIRFLLETGKYPRVTDERLGEFADFVSEHVHRKYELVTFLRYGFAFHFGNLPPAVRQGVEELIRDGSIKVVAATSTLLQGLNLPTKSIYVCKPSSGLGNPMSPHDFWNLAGRAGRLGKDTSGYVYCVNVDEWPQNPLHKERTISVISAVEKRLRDESESFSKSVTKEIPATEDEYNEQVLSAALREKILHKRMLADSEYVSSSNVGVLNEIDAKLEEIISEFKPPKEVILMNPGVHPKRLDSLWEHFENVGDDLYEWIPPFPKNEEFFGKFLAIVGIIARCFNRQVNDKYITKLVVVSRQWMTGIPYSVILTYKLNSSEPDLITKHIIRAMKFLEQNIHYELSRDLTIYMNTLSEYCRCNRKQLEISTSTMTYLEYGACTLPALTFMSMGLSRTSALELERRVPYSSPTRQQCLDWLMRFNVESLDLPHFLNREVRDAQIMLRNK